MQLCYNVLLARGWGYSFSADTTQFEVRTRSEATATETTCVQHHEMIKTFNEIVAPSIGADGGARVPGTMPDETWPRLTLLTQVRDGRGTLRVHGMVSFLTARGGIGVCLPPK